MNGPLEVITRKDFMSRLGYKSIHGFNEHLEHHPECPRPFKFSPGGRVFFSLAEVEAYLADLAKSVAQIMPGDKNVVL